MSLFPIESYYSNLPSLAVPATDQSEERSLSDVGNLGDPSAELVRLFDGRSSSAGVQVNENTCMSISTVWACIRNLAEDIAGCMFDVYERSGSRDRKRVIDHPLFHLMNTEPNPEMIPFEFRQAVTANAILWGNGYAEIERLGDGTPIALWPIQAWRVVARRDANNQLFYQVDTKQADGSYVIQPWNMLRIGGFSNNGLVGYMLAREAKDSWGLAMAAERFACTFYGNGTRPGGWLETPGKLDPLAAANLRRSIEEVHRGVDRAHRLMIFEAGLKYNESHINAQEAQAVESRQYQVSQLASWFRMPVHMVGEMSRSTFSNIEHLSISYVNTTLRGWFRKWEQETKAKLCTSSDKLMYGIHDYTDLLRGDQVAQATAETKLVLGAVKTPNESRSKLNLDPIEGGDELLAPANFTTLNGLKHAAVQAQAEAAQAQADAGITPGDQDSVLNVDAAINPDDVPGGVVDQAEGEPIDRSPLRPPPIGVISPGQQPGMDSYFTGFRALAKAQTPLLVGAVKSLLHTEADKCTRASRKPDFGQFVDKFYRGHRERVRDSLATPVMAMVESSIAISGKSITPDLRTKVQGFIDGMVDRHVLASRSDLTDLQDLPQRVSWWEENRATPFVATEIDSLANLLVGAK